MSARVRIAILVALVTLLMPLGAPVAQTPILAGPLAKLDIQNAQIEPGRGKPKGTLTIAMHITLDPGWLDPLEHSYAITQVKYDYFVHDALIKPMPQGEATYSLAEHAEMSADYKEAGFRLRSGLKFHDGTPLPPPTSNGPMRTSRAPTPRSSTTSSTIFKSWTIARSSFTSRNPSSTSWISTTAS